MVVPKNDVGDGFLFVNDKHPSGPSWVGVWYDDAGRKVKRRLGLKDEMARGKAIKEASDAYVKQQQAHRAKLAIKDEMDPDPLEDLCQRAAFPRAVVADQIKRLCERIARVDTDETRSGRPGLQLFAERTGISSREVHRLIEDEERISVGYDTVDKICAEFDMLFDDFIDESKHWADRTGQWVDRAGARDCWPIGYEVTAKPDIGLDLL